MVFFAGFIWHIFWAGMLACVCGSGVLKNQTVLCRIQIDIMLVSLETFLELEQHVPYIIQMAVMLEDLTIWYKYDILMSQMPEGHSCL